MKQLLTMAFLMTTIFAFGQTNTSKSEEQPYIEVTGTAEKEVIPDEIYIGIIIREKYVNKEKVTIEEQEQKLKHGSSRPKKAAHQLSENRQFQLWNLLSIKRQECRGKILHSKQN